MKIGIAQLNFKIGALRSNANAIIESMERLDKQDAELVVFPELATTGYYPWDLLDQPGFVAQQQVEIDRIVEATRNLKCMIAFGCVTVNTGPGKPYFNSMALALGGSIITYAHKQLLPTYNIYDERRHFEPGKETTILEINGRKIAFLICEDSWNDTDTAYANNPLSELANQNIEALITINASPWQLNKQFTRSKLFGEISTRRNMPILYVNQVGGHDEILYDGASFAVNNGQIVWNGPFANTCETIVELGNDGFASSEESAPWPSLAADQQLQMIVLGLRDYMSKCGFKQVVVGSSGGIDSALTLAIAEIALGAQNVKAITMPSKYSSEGSVSDSVELCDRLGVELFNAPIKDGFDAQMATYSSTFGRSPARIAIENTQARLRGLMLMTYANDTGAMLLSTGNKSEVSVGYCTLYGDMNGGLNAIGDLYKMEVYAIAKHINEIDPRRPIPNAIIDKEPSAELFENQADSDSLPPYPQLDAILRLYIERDLLDQSEIDSAKETLANYSTANETIERIIKMVDRAEFKRWQACPILRTHARAFGSGRRYPIAQGFVPDANSFLTH